MLIKQYLENLIQACNPTLLEQSLAAWPELVNMQDEEGNTLLHHMVKAGSGTFMRLFDTLKAHKPNPFIQDKEYGTALHYAAYFSSEVLSGSVYEIVFPRLLQYYVEQNYDFSTLNQHGHAILHIAAVVVSFTRKLRTYKGNNIVLLLESVPNLDVNVLSGEGLSPLAYLIINKPYPELELLLLEAGASLLQSGKNAESALNIIEREIDERKSYLEHDVLFSKHNFGFERGHFEIRVTYLNDLCRRFLSERDWIYFQSRPQIRSMQRLIHRKHTPKIIQAFRKGEDARKALTDILMLSGLPIVDECNLSEVKTNAYIKAVERAFDKSLELGLDLISGSIFLDAIFEFIVRNKSKTEAVSFLRKYAFSGISDAVVIYSKCQTQTLLGTKSLQETIAIKTDLEELGISCLRSTRIPNNKIGFFILESIGSCFYGPFTDEYIYHLFEKNPFTLDSITKWVLDESTKVVNNRFSQYCVGVDMEAVIAILELAAKPSLSIAMALETQDSLMKRIKTTNIESTRLLLKLLEHVFVWNPFLATILQTRLTRLIEIQQRVSDHCQKYAVAPIAAISYKTHKDIYTKEVTERRAEIESLSKGDFTVRQSGIHSFFNSKKYDPFTHIISSSSANAEGPGNQP